MIKSLKNIGIKDTYDSDDDDLLNSFYIPALSVSTRYRRLAGFFSSGIFSAASRGVAGLIQNGGRMELIVGAQLHDEDVEVIEKALKSPEEYVEKVLMDELDKAEDFLKDEHVEAMGWMIANDLLEIRIALVNNRALFHMKVGILEDADGNKLSFSGSDNETPSGWKYNIEEFKVFRDWDGPSNKYFDSDVSKFQKFWLGQGTRVRTVGLPFAVKQRLIKNTPKRKEDLQLFKPTQKVVESTISQAVLPRVISLYPHQEKAIAELDAHSGRGILSMATGSGKTLTSLEYARRCRSEQRCTIIAVPYLHLVKQWADKDVRPMFPGVPIVEVHGQSKEWKTALPLFLSGLRTGTFKHIVIVGLYGALASKEFTEAITSANLSKESILFIADEVHNAGAPESQKSMLEIYHKRVGLSATPNRYFDEEGTDIVKNYFGGVIFEYGLSQAIEDKWLTPYNYFPIIVRLSEEEYVEYKEISAQISRAVAIAGDSKPNGIRDDVTRLLIKRSKIIKGAINKISQLTALLAELKRGDISNTLIYCDGMEQLEQAQIILNRLGIINHKFTQSETLELREEILRNFASGTYKALVAIKCLDEGVDVPATKTAVIVASTSNPREFIQRRGRVLRKSAGKSQANVYDFVVVPPGGRSSLINKSEKSILQNEFQRVRDFIDTASNKAEIYEDFLGIMEEFGVYL